MVLCLYNVSNIVRELAIYTKMNIMYVINHFVNHFVNINDYSTDSLSSKKYITNSDL